MMNAEDYEWIGIVNPADIKPEVTFITPLAYFVDGAWKPIVLDARRQWFPNSGKAAIFVKDIPITTIGRLWLFHPERNTQLLPPSIHGYSYYLVSGELGPAPLAQIIDWTSRVNHSYELIDLLNEGIAAKDCYCRRVYIYSLSRLYGPLIVAPDADRFKPREYIQGSGTGEQTLFVWMYTVPEDGFLDLTHIYAQFTFLDEHMLDTPTGKEDWSLPQVTIKRFLEASNKVFPDMEDYVHLVDRRLQDLAHIGSREELFGLQLEPATIKRAQYILSNQLERLQDLHRIIEQLSPEHLLMKAARTWEIQARVQKIEQEAEAFIHDRQEQLQQLQDGIEEAQARLNQIQDAADVAQQRYAQAVEAFDTFERDARERLAALKQDPLRILAELQITASLFPVLVDGSRQTSNGVRIQRPYPLIPQQSKQHATVSESGLNWWSKDSTSPNTVRLQELHAKRWVQAAQQIGVNSKDVRICAAALAAGLIPAVEGENAVLTLKAVAQVIADGRIAVVPIQLTALSTLDLFGTIDMHRQMFVPATGGLADCILQAEQHPDELVLIVLEGIDRAPGMPVYVPLLRQYMEVRQSASDLVGIAPINLFHPRALDPEDPYSKMACFIWPQNVLLALTLDGDVNSLPLPAVCDRWLVLRELTEMKSDTSPNRKPSPIHTGISLERWQIWEEEVRSTTVSAADLQELLDYRQKAFHAALTMLNVKDPDAVVEHTWTGLFQENDGETE